MRVAVLVALAALPIAWPASMAMQSAPPGASATRRRERARRRRPQPRRPTGRGSRHRRAGARRGNGSLRDARGSRDPRVARVAARVARTRGTGRRAVARSAPAHRDCHSDARPAAVAHGDARRAAGGLRGAPSQRCAALRRAAGVGAAAHRARGRTVARDLRHRVHGASTWAVRAAGPPPAQLTVRVALGVQRPGPRPPRRPRLRQSRRRRRSARPPPAAWCSSRRSISRGTRSCSTTAMACIRSSAHMQRTLVREGQVVERGARLGTVGATGRASGAAPPLVGAGRVDARGSGSPAGPAGRAGGTGAP